MQKLIDSNKIQIDYDFSGASNFLIVGVPSGKDIINFQVQMLYNNVTENFLHVRKVQFNNSAQLYYDITNKATLSQLLKNDKISKSILLKLVKSILNAMEEASEYQLEDKGIVLDRRYIYMETLNSTPLFVFLPFYRENSGVRIIGDFLLDLKRDDVLDTKCDYEAKSIIEATYASDSSINKISALLNELMSAQSQEEFTAYEKNEENILNKINRGQEVEENSIDIDALFSEPDEPKEIKSAKDVEELLRHIELGGTNTDINTPPIFNSFNNPEIKPADFIDVEQNNNEQVINFDNINLNGLEEKKDIGFKQPASSDVNKKHLNQQPPFGMNSSLPKQEMDFKKPEEQIGPTFNSFDVDINSDYTSSFGKPETKVSFEQPEVKKEPPADSFFNFGDSEKDDSIEDLRRQIFGETTEIREQENRKIVEQYSPNSGIQKNQDPYGDKINKSKDYNKDSIKKIQSSMGSISKKPPLPNTVLGAGSNPFEREVGDEEERNALERMKQIEDMAKTPPKIISSKYDDTEFIDMESDYVKKREQEIASYIKGKGKQPFQNNVAPNPVNQTAPPLPRQPVSEIEEGKTKTNQVYFFLSVVMGVVFIAILTIAGVFKSANGINFANIGITFAFVGLFLFTTYKLFIQGKGTSDEKLDNIEDIRPGKEITNKPQKKMFGGKSSLKEINEDVEDTVFVAEAVSEKSMPYLTTVVDGVTQKIFINKPSFIIGRFVGKVDYVCQSNKVGKVHAEIINRDGVYFVNDLNSRNGTYINSYRQRIISNIDYPLDNGDLIILADVEFTIHI